MSYFPEGEHSRRRSGLSLFTILTVAVLAAFIGGVLSQIAGSKIGNNNTPQTQNQQQNSNPSQSYEAALANNRIVAIAKDVGPSVVGITNIARKNVFGATQEQGSGSGVIFDTAGYIVTNYHVVQGATELTVSLADGRSADAKLIGSDQRTDLAVIKVDLNNLKAIQFADSDALQVGELVVAIGNPGGKEFFGSVTAGIVSGLNRELSGSEGTIARLIQTDAAINPGNSGGALVNGQGQLIGINSIKIALEGFEGMGFAIPSNTVKEIIDALKTKGKVTRAALGVTLERAGNITPEIAARYNLIVDYGVIVNPVPGGASEKAGIKNGDIIIAINDREVRNDAGLMRELFSYKPGDTIKVTLVRNNKKQEVHVTLGELTQ